MAPRRSEYWYVDYLAQPGLYFKCIEVEAWGDAFPPACACGCGEPVHFCTRGPNKYVNRAHVAWDRSASGSSEAAKLARREMQLKRNIPIEKWRAAVRKIKAERGWTCEEIAHRGGWSLNNYRSWMYSTRVNTIGQTGVDFLRRLAGLPAPATAWQIRQRDESAKRMRKNQWD